MSLHKLKSEAVIVIKLLILNIIKERNPSIIKM